MEDPLEQLWAWAESEDAESWEGPFKTREEAVAFGEGRGGETSGVVAKCSLVRPEEWITSGLLFDTDRVLEEMEDNLQMEWGGFDDATFVIPAEKQLQAQDDLVMLLKTWAENYVTARGRFCVTGSAERVTP